MSLDEANQANAMQCNVSKLLEHKQCDLKHDIQCTEWSDPVEWYMYGII